MLRGPRAARIIWVGNPAWGGAQQHKDRLHHGSPPHIHGVGFAEGNSSDIHGLSAIIARTVAHKTI